MAPWTGRVRDGRFTFDGVAYQLPLNKPPHAIHGTARDHPWTVDASGDSSAVLAQELTPRPMTPEAVMAAVKGIA